MTQKNIPPIPVIYFSTRTTFREISKFVANVAKELYATAASNELLPTGPIHWVYDGADGKPDTEFDLEIALPVNGYLKPWSAFAEKTLPAFECATVLHQGAWDHLFETYDQLIDEIKSQGKQMTGICREQYIYMDFNDPTNNITQVQIGIQ